MSTQYLIFICLFLLICAIIWWLKPKKRRNPFTDGSALPYTKRRIMTQTELKVYHLLCQALPDYMICPQVQASRVLDLPKNKENYYWFNFISRLSYDFVVCRCDGLPLAIIEVDDATHQLSARQEADHRKNKATEAAGIAVIRWKVGEIPDAHSIKRHIQRIDKKTR